jgi:sacsin
LAILDPHVAFLPFGACGGKPGLRVRLAPSQATQFPAQFAPFVNRFGTGACTTAFGGTLFRFPLRTPLMAARSEIKPGQAYTRTDVERLFASFQEQADSLLLFLTNLRKIEVQWEPQRGETHVLFCTSSAVEPLNAALPTVWPLLPRAGGEQESSWRAIRQQVRQGSMTHPDLLKLLQDAGLLFEHAVKRVSMQRMAASSRGLLALPDAAAVVAPVPEETHSTWLQVGTAGQGEALALAQASESARLRLLPWAAVALPIVLAERDLDTGPGRGLTGVIHLALGPVYAFLPLPIESPLPVAINGGFEVSSNRRDLWSGADMTGDGKQRSVRRHAHSTSSSHPSLPSPPPPFPNHPPPPLLLFAVSLAFVLEPSPSPKGHVCACACTRC